jgi:hypothetical protein
MTVHSFILFAHVASTLGIVAALVTEALTLSRLETAATSAEARLWIELAPGLPFLAFGSLVVVLFSGIYLTAQMSGWSLAWPKVALATFILILPLGAATGRKMRSIRRACASEANFAGLAEKLRDPFPRFSLNIRIALVLGMVLLMTAKQGLAGSLVIVGGFAALGFAWTLFIGRPGMALPVVKDGKRR